MSFMFTNTTVTFSIIVFHGKRKFLSLQKPLSISRTQFMNMRPSKAGQKSKFIIQDIIYSYLSRPPLYT